MGVLRRLWAAPLWAHALVLAVLLAALFVASRPGVAWSADEGIGILQAELLDDPGRWVYEHPLADLDPEGGARPFVWGEEGANGVVPYARHPLYPVLLVPAVQVGPAGPAAVSMVGVLAASLLVASVARRLDDGLARPARWFAGLGSPLLFDGYLALAHTWAAACVALALLGALRLLERWRWLDVAALVVGVVGAVLLRSEALFVGPAIAVAAVVASLRRPTLSRAVPIAAVAVVSAGLAWIGEDWWSRQILGSTSTTSVPAVDSSWLSGRIEGFRLTWLAASYDHDPLGDALLRLGVVACTAGLVLLGRRLSSQTVGLALVATGAACYVVRAVAVPADPVPGLLLAVPLLAGGLLCLRRTHLDDLAVRVLGVAAVLTVGGIAVTQYSRGGGYEWGGRYFAVALPMLLPLALVGLREVATAVASTGRRPLLVTGAVVITAAVLVLGVRDIRAHHDRVREVAANLEAAAPAVTPTEATGRPLVVSPAGRLLPQIVYPHFDDYDWMVWSGTDTRRYTERLAEAGIDSFLLYTVNPEGTLEEMAEWYEPVDEVGEGRLAVRVMERR
jgi:hypothetical protein